MLEGRGIMGKTKRLSYKGESPTTQRCPKFLLLEAFQTM